ncbi:MurR/RpiR family transcriptional regulator [Gracilibacillus timonensis]|uniref:hypothetical protein n=1 Tax=Gracilibacillus timonensis TaxID=1816696 RepID=UPI00370983D3
MVKAADKFSYLNVKSVAITNNPGSPLFDLVDIGISTTVQKASCEGYDVSARSTLVILFEIQDEAIKSPELRLQKHSFRLRFNPTIVIAHIVVEEFLLESSVELRCSFFMIYSIVRFFISYKT